MRFPEHPSVSRAPRVTKHARRGDAAHTRAIEQFAEARTAQRRLTQVADAAKGTPRASEAADARDAARDRFAAKEAWLIWVERRVE